MFRLNIFEKEKYFLAEKENEKWNSRFSFPCCRFHYLEDVSLEFFFNFSREINSENYESRLLWNLAIVKYAIIKICSNTLGSLLSLSVMNETIKVSFLSNSKRKKRISPTILRILVLWISARFQRGGGTDKIQNREQKGGSWKWRIPGRLGAKRK